MCEHCISDRLVGRLISKPDYAIDVSRVRFLVRTCVCVVSINIRICGNGCVYIFKVGFYEGYFVRGCIPYYLCVCIEISMSIVKILIRTYRVVDFITLRIYLFFDRLYITSVSVAAVFHLREVYRCHGPLWRVPKWNMTAVYLCMWHTDSNSPSTAPVFIGDIGLIYLILRRIFMRVTSLYINILLQYVLSAQLKHEPLDCLNICSQFNRREF